MSQQKKEDSRVDHSQYDRPLATASQNKLVPTTGYCRNCEALCGLTRGERCNMCRSNDTRRLTEAELARAFDAVAGEGEVL